MHIYTVHLWHVVTSLVAEVQWGETGLQVSF